MGSEKYSMQTDDNLRDRDIDMRGQLFRTRRQRGYKIGKKKFHANVIE